MHMIIDWLRKLNTNEVTRIIIRYLKWQTVLSLPFIWMLTFPEKQRSETLKEKTFRYQMLNKFKWSRPLIGNLSYKRLELINSTLRWYTHFISAVSDTCVQWSLFFFFFTEQVIFFKIILNISSSSFLIDRTEWRTGKKRKRKSRFTI